MILTVSYNNSPWYKIMSVNRSFSLTKLEESILRQYKRVSFGEETPQYEIESIYYSDIPKELPDEIARPFYRSIVLYNYSYFEMVSFAVFEHLFRVHPQLRKTVVDRIKGRICNQDFMFGSNYIKGQLVKGVRSILDHGERTAKPIAQILLKNDAMNAFSQFWKEVIEEQSQGSNVKHTDIPQGVAYKLIANFLGLNFQLFWKRENGYEEERVMAENRLTQEFMTIVIFEKTLMESIITKVLQESIANESNQRGYVLLLKETPATPANAPQPSKMDHLRDLKLWGSEVRKKGGELVNRFRQFHRQMRDGLE